MDVGTGLHPLLGLDPGPDLWLSTASGALELRFENSRLYRAVQLTQEKYDLLCSARVSSMYREHSGPARGRGGMGGGVFKDRQ